MKNNFAKIFSKLVVVAGFLFVSIFFVACRRQSSYRDSKNSIAKILQDGGCGDRTIGTLLQLGITDKEALDVVKMRDAGLADASTVRVFQLARGQSPIFMIGEDVAELRDAGMNDLVIIDVISLHALPEWTNDIVLMRNAGVSEQSIDHLAALRWNNKCTIRGADIAEIKNTGFSETGIESLAQLPLHENDVAEILRLRSAGTDENGVLQRMKSSH